MKYLAVLLSLLFLLLQSCTKHVRQAEVIDTRIIEKEIQYRGLKRKVAIARFSNESKYGKGIFYNKEKDPLGKQTMDILSSKLGSTGKFILLERSDINLVEGENDFSKINVNADYLIIGSLSEFGRNVTSDVGVFSRSKKQKAYAKVNIRLVEVKTGMIVFSEEGAGEAFLEENSTMGGGSRAGHDSSINDKAIDAAISKLVNNLVEKLTDKPWRSFILSESDGTYIISGGESQGLKVGDIFNVLIKGKEVKNPQTGMLIELPGKQIGKVKILSSLGDTIESEVSICSLVSGNINVDLSELFIQEIK